MAWRSVGVRGILRMIVNVLSDIWIRYWMRFAGLNRFGRIATRLATWFAPPYFARCYLAWLSPRGYVAPGTIIHHTDLRLGTRVFIGERVVIFQDKNGGPAELGDSVHLYGDIYIQTGDGGSIKIGARTTVQPHCQFSAYKAPIQIGCDVQIAPRCAFYPYDHSFASGELIRKQPLRTKGGIIIEDDVWLGFGVIVLDGVRIGKGAVIGAGAVVTRDIPEGAIAFGVPACVVKMRH
jgi:acetyltransferase-like isoleucine patch superfamily enzyme